MALKVFENKTRQLIAFTVPCFNRFGERRPKWITVRPSESLEIEENDLEKSGPTSWEKAELFGLVEKKGSVQNIVKTELPPESLAIIPNIIPVIPIVKKRGRKKKVL